MERLTKTYSDGTHGAADHLPCGENSYEYKRLLLDALGKYEDLEEQGRLLRLPCKVGDTIYIVFYNHTIGEREVVSFKMIAEGWAVKTNDWSYLFTDFGKTVFLTRAEAESKLKEMESSHAENRSV